MSPARLEFFVDVRDKAERHKGKPDEGPKKPAALIFSVLSGHNKWIASNIKHSSESLGHNKI